ncbi:ASCH domain-containing protein [Enterococcus alcedinis]|uniref:RNA-binding protein n=1 Tax=Enterococcus alcedinis TaxID=1274384 RepID=A0A917N5P8_9ENTE|nr:ASCH domain-containing protein [Enterococcus alcedinis]MBP2102980.1 uncharacterized protein YhfF [Enterococcus alcedinis]GGI66546.1 RNA-binding protein [Enterococcus alcedinis]
MNIETYWQQFLTTMNLPKETKYFEAFYFGSDQQSAEHLLQLVLEGKKRATSSAEEEYFLTNEPEPKVGDYSIVTDFSGNPKCIIQTTEVLKLKFNDMTYDIFRLEGEDLTLETWQEKHIEFFNTVGAIVGYQYHPDMMLVFEKFEMVSSERYC